MDPNAAPSSPQQKNESSPPKVLDGQGNGTGVSPSQLQSDAVPLTSDTAASTPPKSSHFSPTISTEPAPPLPQADPKVLNTINNKNPADAPPQEGIGSAGAYFASYAENFQKEQEHIIVAADFARTKRMLMYTPKEIRLLLTQDGYTAREVEAAILQTFTDEELKADAEKKKSDGKKNSGIPAVPWPIIVAVVFIVIAVFLFFMLK